MFVLDGYRFPVIEDEGDRAGVPWIVTGMLPAVQDNVTRFPHDRFVTILPQGIEAGQVHIEDPEIPVHDQDTIEEGIQDLFQFRSG